MPLKVFYLDDEPDLTEIFCDLFSSDQIQVFPFTTVDEFLAEVRINPPDVVLLDYRLPNTTGDKVAQLLDPAIPKALITGEISVKPNPSFVTILAKPFDMDLISKFLRNYIR